MAGIYLHIPFCRKACHYCNFHFSTGVTSTGPVINAIAAEAEIQNGYLQEDIATVYFGGGTPSLLGNKDLEILLTAIKNNYKLLPDAEITLEANPDDISEARLEQWQKSGINRLSIGVQSFFEAELAWMNRAHTALQSEQSIMWAQRNGFKNLSIDLIYGTPGLSDEKWSTNLEKAGLFEIPHLSCYALTVEKNTALEKMIRKHKTANVDPAIQSRQFEYLMHWSARHGYEHYEISNFAKQGHRSKHNSSYWAGISYLGLGPSAHSFNGTSRQWNIANNNSYVKSIETGVVPFEIEILDAPMQLNEFIMIRLRTAEGLPLKIVSEKWGEATVNQIHQNAAAFISGKKMLCINDTLVLTDEGKLFADGIAASLFM